MLAKRPLATSLRITARNLSHGKAFELVPECLHLVPQQVVFASAHRQGQARMLEALGHCVAVYQFPRTHSA
eukprot:12355155-Alexandrium_andersonii.AAC.1